jgi:gas vesicle protein
MRDYDDDDLPFVVVEKHSGSFGAFVWGAVIGAGVALLFAPRSGRETRDDILGGARRIRETAEETASRMQGAVTGTIDSVRQQVTDRIDSARSAMDAGRRAARETRSDMQRRTRETRPGFESSTRASREASAFDTAELDADDDQL